MELLERLKSGSRGLHKLHPFKKQVDFNPALWLCLTVAGNTSSVVWVFEGVSWMTVYLIQGAKKRNIDYKFVVFWLFLNDGF